MLTSVEVIDRLKMLHVKYFHPLFKFEDGLYALAHFHAMSMSLLAGINFILLQKMVHLMRGVDTNKSE